MEGTPLDGCQSPELRSELRMVVPSSSAVSYSGELPETCTCAVRVDCSRIPSNLGSVLEIFAYQVGTLLLLVSHIPDLQYT